LPFYYKPLESNPQTGEIEVIKIETNFDYTVL